MAPLAPVRLRAVRGVQGGPVVLGVLLLAEAPAVRLQVVPHLPVEVQGVHHPDFRRLLAVADLPVDLLLRRGRLPLLGLLHLLLLLEAAAVVEPEQARFPFEELSGLKALGNSSVARPQRRQLAARWVESPHSKRSCSADTRNSLLPLELHPELTCSDRPGAGTRPDSQMSQLPPTYSVAEAR